MAISNREELAEHLGHDIEVAQYAGGESVTIECITCGGVVLIAAEDLEQDEGEPLITTFPGRIYLDPTNAENPLSTDNE